MARLGPKSGGGGDGEPTIPPGEYVIALKSFRRQRGKTSGKEFLRCSWVICAGPLEGKRLFTNVSMNLDTEGSVNRWRIWMEVCGVTEEIELGSIDEGTQAEGDANIKEHFEGVPFVVTIKVEKNGAYTNHDIERIHYVRLWTDSQKADMDRWLDAQANVGQSGGNPEVGQDAPKHGGGFADDDQDYGPPGGGTKAGGFAGGDDDIPF